MRATVVGLGLVVVGVVALALPEGTCRRAGALVLPGWRFQQSYERLKVGLTEGEAAAVFGRAPDYICRFRSYRIIYYQQPNLTWGIFDTSGEVPKIESVSVPSEIPSIYAAVQIAVGPDGRVIAFTQNGEELAVHTRDGALPGSSLSEVGSRILE